MPATTKSRARTFCLSFGVSLALLAAAPFTNAADEGATYQFNLSAQPLSDALKAVGQQSAMNILFDPRSVQNRAARSLQATLTTKEAIDRLLDGTDLVAKQTSPDTILVEPRRLAPSSVSGQSPPSVKDYPEDGRDSPEPLPAVSTNQGAPANDKVEGPASEPIRLEEVVVTGSHIRGEDPAGSRVIRIDRDTIDKSGYGRLEDLLAVLPQNFVGTGELANQPNVLNYGRGAEVQLRGLGPGTTLTLVDGQRAPSSGTQGAFVDISNIPTAAIERVEILPDGASALYGSDAIGGVVNVILRKDYQGAETRVRFGEASGGQAKETGVSQLFGTHWSSGHVLVGYQYTRRGDLVFASRPYTAASFNLIPFGGDDFRTVGGNPGEILNARRQPAFAIPTGQDGTHLTAAQLLPGVTHYRDVPYADELPTQVMHSVFASASQDLNERAQLFLNARYSTRSEKLITGGLTFPVSVPSSNPFYVNPFGGTGPVRVAYDFTRDLGPLTQDSTEDTVMATAGANLSLFADWHLALSGSYARDSTAFDYSNLDNSKALTAALADSNPATALNVFGDGSHTNPATLAAIRESHLEHGVDTTESASAVADGSLFELPGGVVRLAIGTEYRRDTLRSTSNGVDHYDRASSDRRDFAGFAEFAVPLISETQRVPLIQKLELSLAGRYDDYSDAGSTTNPKFGATWVIVKALKLRGTWGKSFRAPPFYLTNSALRTTLVSSQVDKDPLSPTGTSTVLDYSGTNPNLRPETAKTWTAGVDFQPLDNLLISATYFNINYNDKIQAPPDLDPLVVESRYANTGVIIRNPTRAQLDALCNLPLIFPVEDCTGPFAAIINRGQRNLAATRVRGLDFDMAYHRPTTIGTFGLGISGTYTFNDDQRVTPTSPNFDLVDTLGNPLALRAQGTLSWSFRRWSANATILHTGSYTDPNPALVRKINSWTTVNLGVGYEVPANSGWLSNTRVFLTAVNAFDKLPPFANETFGYDTANANLLRRTGSIEVSKRW